MTHPFLDLIAQRVLILDGAMGTSLHRYRPTVADWGGDHLVNLSDALAFTRPEWIRDIHRGFLAVG
jgi:5-methyltetrahydrofolate--homocysteine methyltransferase